MIEWLIDRGPWLLVAIVLALEWFGLIRVGVGALNDLRERSPGFWRGYWRSVGEFRNACIEWVACAIWLIVLSVALWVSQTTHSMLCLALASATAIGLPMAFVSWATVSWLDGDLFGWGGHGWCFYATKELKRHEQRRKRNIAWSLLVLLISAVSLGVSWRGWESPWVVLYDVALLPPVLVGSITLLLVARGELRDIRGELHQRARRRESTDVSVE